MRCPVDGGEMALDTFDVNARIVPFHQCGKCEGSFVAGEDLQKFAKDAHVKLDGDRLAEPSHGQWRHCPNCVRGMQEQHLQGINLDFCTSCGGVWYDAGELRRFRRKGKHDLFAVGPGASRSPKYLATWAAFAAALASAIAFNRALKR